MNTGKSGQNDISTFQILHIYILVLLIHLLRILIQRQHSHKGKAALH